MTKGVFSLHARSIIGVGFWCLVVFFCRRKDFSEIYILKSELSRSRPPPPFMKPSENSKNKSIFKLLYILHRRFLTHFNFQLSCYICFDNELQIIAKKAV